MFTPLLPEAFPGCPPLVSIIRGFEPPTSPDCDVVLVSRPADLFIVATEAGILPLSFAPRDKHTDNWGDDWHHGARATKIRSEATPYDPAFASYWLSRKENRDKSRNRWHRSPETAL